MTTAILTARPVLELPEAGAPSEFRILRAGLNRTGKGDFLFDGTAAEAVMAAYTAKGLDKLQIDFEHQSMQAPPAGGDAAKPAAGWFRPEVRDGELWATAVTWTMRALSMLAPPLGAPEYRYFSPILFFDEDTRRVTGLKNLALTNDPALDELRPLVAATAVFPDRDHQRKDTNMSDEQSDDRRRSAMATLTAADYRVAEEMGTNVEAFALWRASKDDDAALVASLTSAERQAAEAFHGRGNIKAIAESIRGIRRMEAERAEHARRYGV